MGAAAAADMAMPSAALVSECGFKGAAWGGGSGRACGCWRRAGAQVSTRQPTNTHPAGWGEVWWQVISHSRWRAGGRARQHALAGTCTPSGGGGVEVSGAPRRQAGWGLDGVVDRGAAWLCALVCLRGGGWRGRVGGRGEGRPQGAGRLWGWQRLGAAVALLPARWHGPRAVLAVAAAAGASAGGGQGTTGDTR